MVEVEQLRKHGIRIEAHVCIPSGDMTLNRTTNKVVLKGTYSLRSFSIVLSSIMVREAEGRRAMLPSAAVSPSRLISVSKQDEKD